MNLFDLPEIAPMSAAPIALALFDVDAIQRATSASERNGGISPRHGIALDLFSNLHTEEQPSQ